MNKRAISLGVAVLLLVLTLMPLAAFAMTWDAYVYTANGKGLNLRTGPTTNASIQRSVPYGATVTIIDMYDDTWAQVAYGGYEGFVMRRYLTYDKPGPKPTVKPTATKSSGGGSSGGSVGHLFDGFQVTSYHVTVRPSSPGGFVHMRWAPTKDSGIMQDLHQGDELEVLAQNNTWAQVRIPSTGATGFMMRSFLTDIGIGEGASESDS